MAPKKKNNKKQQDDWEAELGETVDPIAAALAENKENGASGEAEEEEETGGGGLMAAMRKNRDKKKKKGKFVDDFVEGEDPPTAETEQADEAAELAAKAPEEATMDDEFALPEKKGKGKAGNAKGGKPAAKEAEEAEGGEGEERGADGHIMSKKEKEKAKKEREKQRKKEQVSISIAAYCASQTDCLISGCRKEEGRSSC